MNFIKERESKNFTRRESPYFDGYYAVQGLPKAASGVTITSYIKNLEEAHARRERFSKSRQWDKVALRAGRQSWDVYDSRGKLECLCSDISTSDIPDSVRHEFVDYLALDADVTRLLGRKCHRIASQAWHAGTSALSIVGFRKVFTRLLAQTEECRDNDKYLFVAEPGNYDCRVLVLYADFSGKLEDRTNSVEKACVRRGASLVDGMSQERVGQLHRTGASLLNSWADIRHAIAGDKLCEMFSEEWVDAMKTALVGARRDYLRSVFATAVGALADRCDATGALFDITDTFGSTLSAANEKLDKSVFREILARTLLTNLGNEFRQDRPGDPEYLPESCILENATELAAMLRETWSMWRRQSRKVLVG